MNQALAKLVIEKVITVKEALHYTPEKEQLTNLIGLKELIAKQGVGEKVAVLH